MKHKLFIAPYEDCILPFSVHIWVGLGSYGVAAVVLWLFYRSWQMALIGAALFVPVIIAINMVSSKKRRLNRLLGQFQNLLESLVVSLQAGSTDLGAFQHALEDMKLMYSEKTDIVKETETIILKFANGISIGAALTDFANRCGLSDVKLFAAVYLSVEGKGEKTREIVLRTQKILSDKIAIEQEIKTMSSGAVMEINVMVAIPVIIVTIVGFMGGELLQGLFTTPGRVVTTIAIAIFIGAYALGRKITSIKV
ncbi:MAG: type II secretion system F family protein [Defluviitaleaceae bacterium]|nr:type II secretion system F family protein [Defluviitaleaceae bacterium]